MIILTHHYTKFRLMDPLLILKSATDPSIGKRFRLTIRVLDRLKRKRARVLLPRGGGSGTWVLKLI